MKGMLVIFMCIIIITNVKVFIFRIFRRIISGRSSVSEKLSYAQIMFPLAVRVGVGITRGIMVKI